MPGGFQRGQGPNALPQGAATQANEGIDVSGDPFEVPVVFEEPGLEDTELDNDTGMSEDEQFLFDDPFPEYQRSIVPTTRPNRLPKYVIRHLPAAIASLNNPRTPPAWKAMIRATIRQASLERDEDR